MYQVGEKKIFTREDSEYVEAKGQKSSFASKSGGGGKDFKVYRSLIGEKDQSLGGRIEDKKNGGLRGNPEIGKETEGEGR